MEIEVREQAKQRQMGIGNEVNVGTKMQVFVKKKKKLCKARIESRLHSQQPSVFFFVLFSVFQISTYLGRCLKRMLL